MKRTFDYSILIVVSILVLFGILMVYSASFYYADYAKGDPFYFFTKQLIGAVAGAVVMVFFMFFDYKKLIKLQYIGLIIAASLLIAVLIPGVGATLNGSARWINLQVFTFQPSELAKFALIIFMAANMSQKQNRIHTFKFGIMPYLFVSGIFCLLLLLQPNFSAVVCLALLTVTMMIVGGSRLLYLSLAGAVSMVGGYILLFSQDYRRNRILAYQDPWQFPTKEGYQLIQSLYSLGSAGLFGRGLGNSMQKLLFLPYSESDFIFSIIVEEWGLIGALLLLILFGILFYRGIRTAFRAPDMFGALCATGIVAIITIQVLVNVAVVTGSIPPTGVSLPFISAGSSSLVMFMASIGVLLNISSKCNSA